MFYKSLPNHVGKSLNKEARICSVVSKIADRWMESRDVFVAYCTFLKDPEKEIKDEQIDSWTENIQPLKFFILHWSYGSRWFEWDSCISLVYRSKPYIPQQNTNKIPTILPYKSFAATFISHWIINWRSEDKDLKSVSSLQYYKSVY